LSRRNLRFCGKNIALYAALCYPYDKGGFFMNLLDRLEMLMASKGINKKQRAFLLNLMVWLYL
jgi:hypothetical protein